MPDSDIITRCPQCNTAFRVTSNQLAVAEGVVRCGSCLSVFKAVDHKTTDTDEPTPSSDPDLSKDIIDDNTLIKDEEEQGLDLDDDIYDLDTDNKNKKTSLFDRKLQPISQHTRESADESWALDILADLEEDEIEPIVIKRNKEPEQVTEQPLTEDIYEQPTNPINQEPTFSATDSPIELDEPSPPQEEVKPKKKKRFSLFKSKPIQSEAADEPLDFDYDDELINEEPQETQVESEYDNIPLDSPLDIQKEKQSDLETLYFEEDEYSGPSQQELEPELHEEDDSEDTHHAHISDDEIEDAMHSRINYASERSDYLSRIQPEPVEMEWYESERTQKWLWLIGATVLSLTLVIQFASFRFDSLSKHPSYRPYYETACKLVGCQLPDLVNTKKIRATNLVVRSHPNKEKALIIDAILINNAGFEQPYPALRLEFSDLNSRLIASRDLQPSEYLRGELSGAKQMPANQPIQLSLPIIDPGEAAVNYQLNVIKAKP